MVRQRVGRAAREGEVRVFWQADEETQDATHAEDLDGSDHGVGDHDVGRRMAVPLAAEVRDAVYSDCAAHDLSVA